MKPISTRGIWTRGVLYVVIAVIAYLQASDDFRAMVAPGMMIMLGCLSVAAVALRAFIDQSTNSEPLPASDPAEAAKDTNDDTAG